MAPVPWYRNLRWRDFLPWCRRYNNYPNRALFVLAHYRDLLEGTVLDVCCGSSIRYYRQAIGRRYYGLDIADSYKYDDTDTSGGSADRPDHVCNIDREPLPFPDNSYDTVLCIGALEHLDNIHAAYDELFRVARRRVFVQLPNNWPGFFSSMLRGHNYTHRPGYGLHADPLKPGQRHKHFFNLEEACQFLVGRMPAGWKLSVLDCTFEKGNDGWLAWPLYQRAARFTWEKGVVRLGRRKTIVLAILRPFFYYPIYLCEWSLGLLFWAWPGGLSQYDMPGDLGWV